MKKTLLLILLGFSTTLMAQTWVPIADLPTGRHHPVTFALNGKGYAVTGTDASAQLLPTKDFYEYDPVADQWDTLLDFPGSQRSFAIGIALNGLGYMGFGATRTQYLRDFWSYDAQNDQWTQLATCPCSGRRHPAMIGFGNKIYVGLGDDATGNLRDWWMYEINTDSWTQIGSLPGATRHHPFQFEAGGELFAGMGHGFGIFDDWYKLDTSTNSWNAVQDFPGEARVAGTQFSWAGTGFVLSGDGSDHNFMAQGEMWRYTPSTDSWKEFTPHPGISRWAPGSFVINNTVYFFGGLNRVTEQFPLTAYKYDLQAATVSLQEQAAAAFKVFPNPARDVVRWTTSEDFTNVELHNTVGQLVRSAEASEESLNLGNLSKGVYLLTFKNNGRQLHTVKVVKR